MRWWCEEEKGGGGMVGNSDGMGRVACLLGVVASRWRFGMVSLVIRVIGRRYEGRKKERKRGWAHGTMCKYCR